MALLNITKSLISCCVSGQYSIEMMSVLEYSAPYVKQLTEFQNSLSDENFENVFIYKSMQKEHCYEQRFDK